VFTVGTAVIEGSVILGADRVEDDTMTDRIDEVTAGGISVAVAAATVVIAA